ncbi:MAG: hypothetical protein RR482_01585 [Clostridia bacterium]
MNKRAYVDVRKTLGPENGSLYDGDGELLASVEDVQSQVSITSQSFSPLGSSQELSRPMKFKLTLSFSEVIVLSSKLFKDIIAWMNGGPLPSYVFRGVMRSPYDESEESIVYYDCVPDGTIDIQNMKTGELYKRNWSFICNRPPECLSYLNNE